MLKEFIVIIPLIVNLTGFIVSLLMRPISDRIGKKVFLFQLCLIESYSVHSYTWE